MVVKPACLARCTSPVLNLSVTFPYLIDKARLPRLLGEGRQLWTRQTICCATQGYTGDAELPHALKDADLVIIPAGVPRKPGMTRDDLFNINAGIVRTLITAVAEHCPKVRWPGRATCCNPGPAHGVLECVSS